MHPECFTACFTEEINIQRSSTAAFASEKYPRTGASLSGCKETKTNRQGDQFDSTRRTKQ